MANVSEKFGLRPYRKLDGTPLVGAQNRYIISANNTTAIYQGDLVIAETDGTITRHVAQNSTAVIGVFNGCFYTDPTTSKPTFKNFYPGSINASDITAFVVDDPDAVFLMDADATFARADCFKNYSVTNATGNNTTGISEVQLDVSESGTNASFIIQAMDISQDPGNSEETSANGNVLVRINKHFYRDGTGI
jgi:ketosteroid isomerase-like protein